MDKLNTFLPKTVNRRKSLIKKIMQLFAALG